MCYGVCKVFINGNSSCFELKGVVTNLLNKKYYVVIYTVLTLSLLIPSSVITAMVWPSLVGSIFNIWSYTFMFGTMFCLFCCVKKSLNVWSTKQVFV